MITFSGKAHAARIARKVRPRVTRRNKSLSVGPADAQATNLLIEGDNLQAMATLYRERGQVDLILADPPYNTGNDFRYNDRWEEDPNDPGMGDFVSADDGARHTKWMRFMWPRLQMMRSMLKSGGVLAICIDHRELFRMGQMLDELFQERNRLAIINWQKSYAPRNDNRHISTATEYVLVYARDVDKAKTGLLDRTADMDAKYRNPDNDPEGLWQSDNPCAGEGDTHPGMVYGIQNPFTGEIQYPPDGKCWRSERAKIKRWLEVWGGPYESRGLGDGMPSEALVLKGVPVPTPADDPLLLKARKRANKVRRTKVWPQFFFLKAGEGRPRLKRYLERVKKGVVPMTFWAADEYDVPEELGSTSWEHPESGHSQTGINEIDAIIGKGHNFETVKPLKLFEKIIQLWCPPEGLVMDPFAGSGTSGHAVISLNHKTGSSRRFILVEQGRPERGDPYASSLTANRLKRIITGDWASGVRSPLGGGFSFQRLDKRVDAQALLQMERDEMVDTVIASHFDANRKRGSNLIRINGADWRYLVAKNSDNEGFFLVWEGPDKNTDFSSSVYNACAIEAEQAGLKSYYHVYARLYLYQTENVRFYQIPDRILSDFGLDMSSEPFTEAPA
ncbi:MAG TPA: site-specific DNA-methyltransferase [Solirubrobacteraceae bacterium]